MDMEKLRTTYQGLMNAISEANVSAIGIAQEEIRQELDTIAKSSGLKGSLKVDAKWAAGVVKQKNLELVRKSQELVVSRIKALASKITTSGSFQDPNVKHEIQELSATNVKKLKELIAAMNFKVTAKKTGCHDGRTVGENDRDC